MICGSMCRGVFTASPGSPGEPRGAPSPEVAQQEQPGIFKRLAAAGERLAAEGEAAGVPRNKKKQYLEKTTKPIDV